MLIRSPRYWCFMKLAYLDVSLATSNCWESRVLQWNCAQCLWAPTKEGYFLVSFWVWQKQLWGDTRIWEGTLKFQVLSFPLLPPRSLLSLFSLFFSFLSSFFGLSCLSQLCPYSFPLPFLLCCSSGVFSRAFLIYCLSDVAPVCIYLQLLVNVNCKFEKYCMNKNGRKMKTHSNQA